MHIHLADFIRNTPEDTAAEIALRDCVRCGFCIATCPTYQLLGDESDSPRGRIDLVRQAVEGKAITADMQLHLDRCLTCRLCETTCPSGVQFGRILDVGRHIVEQHVGRSFFESYKRKILRSIVPDAARFSKWLRIGQRMRWLLPASLRDQVPAPARAAQPWPENSHPRKMLVLDGCVQPALSPATNAAAARVLDRLGITLMRAPSAGCCGAVTHHLSAHNEALELVKRNIDAWWPHIEAGAEAIIMTASGCGVMVKDYGRLLADDRSYADKAARVSELTKDISEIIAANLEKLRALPAFSARTAAPAKVAFHAPCTLQHTLKLKTDTEALLTALGFELAKVKEAHLCCGSAGTYSILQPELAQRLRTNKIKALIGDAPTAILTANIGCQCHLQGGTELPVRHWMEALDDVLSSHTASR